VATDSGSRSLTLALVYESSDANGREMTFEWSVQFLEPKDIKFLLRVYIFQVS
jgi:hypothetical protein